jgi:hypothetical protein
MDLYSLTELLIIESVVLKIRFVVATTILVPKSPVFLLSLGHEIVDIVVGAITQHFQKVEFLICASVRLNL